MNDRGKTANGPGPFARAVVYFREQKGWNRYRMAKAARRQASEIKKIEEACGSPRLDTIFWVAEALEIDSRELFSKAVELMNEDEMEKAKYNN